MAPDLNIDIKINVPEDVSRDTLAFFQRILGPFADASEFLGDKVRFYRWKTAKTITRAKEIAEETGIEPREIPLKFLVPFLEKCSLEEPDSDLAEIWARLLANASHDAKALNTAFVDVLSQLSSFEAKVLKGFWLEQKEIEFFDLAVWASIHGTVRDIDGRDMAREMVLEGGKPSAIYFEIGSPNKNKAISGDNEDEIIALTNLEILNLIRLFSEYNHSLGLYRSVKIEASLTPLGFAFLNACEKTDKLKRRAGITPSPPSLPE